MNYKREKEQKKLLVTLEINQYYYYYYIFPFELQTNKYIFALLHFNQCIMITKTQPPPSSQFPFLIILRTNFYMAIWVNFPLFIF